MEVRIKLKSEVIQMLKDWRDERLSHYQSRLAEEIDEGVKHALTAQYKIMKIADYGYLAQMYLSYQEIEGRYKND